MGESRSGRRCGDGRQCSAARSNPAPARRRRRPHAREQLPQLRRALVGEYCHCLRPEGACPPHACAPSATTCCTASLHFEGKIWRTLPLLVWRPGELTRRYIDGERAKFVSPIALFLFFVFLMFAVMRASPAALDAERSIRPRQSELQTSIASRRATDRASSRRERDAAVRAGRPTAKIDDANRRRASGSSAISGRSRTARSDRSAKIRRSAPRAG